MKAKLGKVGWVILLTFLAGAQECRLGENRAADPGAEIGNQPVWDQTASYSSHKTWSKFSAGAGHNCAISSDGTLWCWGKNDRGQLGDGLTVNSAFAQKIGKAKDWALVESGVAHACARKSDGTLWCWGDNSSGKLGNGDSTSAIQSSPVKVNKATDWKTISAGGDHTCANKADNTLFCWGDNGSGQLGIGSTSDKNKPTKVGAGWPKVSAGGAHTCGIKSDKSLWCWGNNGNGQLGIGGTAGQTLPVKLNVPVGWTQVSAGQNHACGRKSDSSLWCWGRNAEGQLGDASTADKNAPAQVAGNTWVAVEAGANHTCGKKSDTTVWCWGENHDFQLGDGTSVDQNAPIQLVDNLHNAITDLTAVSVGNSFSCAQKSNGTIYAWGKNDSGQLGDGTTVEKPNPEPIPDPYRSPVLGVWFTDPNKHDYVDGVGLKWVFKDMGVFEFYGGFCNDPAPCMYNPASTYTANNGKLAITGLEPGRDLSADYSLLGNVLKLTNIVFNPSANYLSSATLLRENSFTVTQITPDPGVFTIDGQITGTETDGISSSIWDDNNDNSGGGNGIDHVDVEGMYLARTGATLYVQARVLKGFSNQMQYYLFFERDGDMGIHDENEVVALNWMGENSGTIMNTKWLVGGPADTGSSHPFSDVPNCKAGSVIEFALDLNALGNPTSLLMTFGAKNNKGTVMDSLPNVIVLLP